MANPNELQQNAKTIISNTVALLSKILASNRVLDAQVDSLEYTNAVLRHSLAESLDVIDELQTRLLVYNYVDLTLKYNQK